MVMSVILPLRQRLLNRSKNMRFTNILFSITLFTATFGVHNALAQVNCKQIPDCAELGYSNDTQTCNGSWLYCPFNSNYKKCVPNGASCDDFTDTDKTEWCNDIIPCDGDSSLTLCASSFRCETGYLHGLTSAKNCGNGTIGTKGWKLTSSKVTATDGSSVTCNKCEALACPGNSSTEITSRKDCDKKYGENRYYDFNSAIEGYSGDKECHSCSGVQTCDEIGLVDYENSGKDCEEVSVLGYNQKMITCYDCSHDCGQGHVLVDGDCKPAYESCEDANLYEQQPADNKYCNNINIWLPSGQKETCYDCNADGCCETCADECSWNINQCSGFVHCRTLCEEKYGETCSDNYYY